MNAVRCEINFESIDHGDGLEPFIVANHHHLPVRHPNQQDNDDNDDDDDDDVLDEILDSLEDENTQSIHQLQGNTVQVLIK